MCVCVCVCVLVLGNFLCNSGCCNLLCHAVDGPPPRGEKQTFYRTKNYERKKYGVLPLTISIPLTSVSLLALLILSKYTAKKMVILTLPWLSQL